MSEKNERIAIAGASALLGKELADDLLESPLAAAEIVLLDEGDAAGKLESVGDEATFIQRVEAVAFEDADFVFFTGTKEMAKKHVDEARRFGASIVDMTYALEDEADVLVRSPWVQGVGGTVPDLKTPAVVSAHPAAVMLALVAHRLQFGVDVRSLAATVLQPASEAGRSAMDELHQQTVNLLSFQSLPKEEFDTQVAFNLVPSLGAEARVQMAAGAKRIRKHYEILSDGHLPELALQIAQAPVFHGFAISLLVDLHAPATQEQIETALGCDQIDVVLDDSDPPSNLSAAGQEDIQARVSTEPSGAAESTRFWIWMTADNLKFAALNAIACAVELRKLRPQGSVQ